MKLCSQCQFIYEDEQERCDMDGAQLIYEPTLDHVFPGQALELTAEAPRPDSFELVIPLSTEPLSKNDSESTPTNHRKKAILQIGALALIAAVAFMAFYAVRSALRAKAQSPTKVDKSKSSKPALKPVASAAGFAVEDRDIKNATAETSPSPVKLETKSSASEPVAPLPGIKPLPHLKPLPTLKPIPRLGEQTGSMNRNRQAVIVAVKPKTEPKKESRFGSFLKKTGRVLTKPFKS